MNKFKSQFLFLIMLSTLVYGCGESTNQTAEEPPPTEETPVAEQVQATQPEARKAAIPMISKNSFQNISPGDPIADHQAFIEKGVLRTGEGDFDSYRIKNEDYGTMAYFMPDPKDEKLVGDITVHSPLASTESGIRVGDTFGKLLVVYSGLEVHGSEIESRTYAYKDNLLFRIDEAHGTYELALKEVSKKAKILEIVITR